MGEVFNAQRPIFQLFQKKFKSLKIVKKQRFSHHIFNSNMANEIEQLMEMGFPRNRAEKALAKTNHRGVEPAMEWLFAHSEDADIDEPFAAPQGHILGKVEDQAANAVEQHMDTSSEASSNGAVSGEATPAQAMSLKCEDCGKLLRTELDAQAHAARSGHSNFSESTEEIKPLTEEEKKQKAKELQEKLKQRRKEKEEQEKQEELKREIRRRKQGKDISSIRA